MFKKRDSKKIEDNKILNVDASMQGKLSFNDPVNLCINGNFEGDLETRGTLTIGEKAKVKAKIIGEKIVIKGEVEGEVKAKISLKLSASAKFKGNIITPSLIKDEGAYFKGLCDMEDVASLNENTISLQQTAEFLQIELATVQKWAEEGKIPAIIHGDSWLFNKQEIEKWISERKSTF